jgi:hypothetical protein
MNSGFRMPLQSLAISCTYSRFVSAAATVVVFALQHSCVWSDVHGLTRSPVLHSVGSNGGGGLGHDQIAQSKEQEGERWCRWCAWMSPLDTKGTRKFTVTALQQETLYQRQRESVPPRDRRKLGTIDAQKAPPIPDRRFGSGLTKPAAFVEPDSPSSVPGLVAAVVRRELGFPRATGANRLVPGGLGFVRENPPKWFTQVSRRCAPGVGRPGLGRT